MCSSAAKFVYKPFVHYRHHVLQLLRKVRNDPLRSCSNRSCSQHSTIRRRRSSPVPWCSKYPAKPVRCIVHPTAQLRCVSKAACPPVLCTARQAVRFLGVSRLFIKVPFSPMSFFMSPFLRIEHHNRAQNCVHEILSREFTSVLKLWRGTTFAVIMYTCCTRRDAAERTSAAFYAPGTSTELTFNC